MPDPSSPLIVDGTLDFSGGVDSLKVTTIQSEQNPNGIRRNELPWLVNATVRDGGVTQRTGWQFVGSIHGASGVYQGGFMYEPNSAYPYLILNISGHTYKVDVQTGFAVRDLSADFALTAMPASLLDFHYVQGEKFLVIQAGDGVTLPLFWDGDTLRRSKGITTTTVSPGTNGVNEIPAATAMDYYMGRIWYARDRSYSAGDIVGGQSGTLANNFKDSILNVTESPLVLGGDGFAVPDKSGNIRAIFHNANLNVTLGQGDLMIGTRNMVFSQSVPVSRTDWISTTSNNQPAQKIVQLVNGPVNDRCVMRVNGDVFFQSIEPGVRSLMSSLRYINQWNNPPISANMQRVLSVVDRSLLHAASGVTFGNRMLQTTLPRMTDQGIVHDALMAMDFLPISSFGSTAQPVWEGIYQGLEVFQLFTGDFGGRERAFAVIRSQDGTFQLWELTDSSRYENGDNRVTWTIEFPAFTWGKEFDLKQLVSGELWIDKIYGAVEFKIDYRPDGDPCWKEWHAWKLCSARNSSEDVANPVTYPLTTYREGFRQTITLPKPKPTCETASGRLSDLAYQFQVRLTVHGWCRIRALLLHAQLKGRKLYANMVC